MNDNNRLIFEDETATSSNTSSRRESREGTRFTTIRHGPLSSPSRYLGESNAAMGFERFSQYPEDNRQRRFSQDSNLAGAIR